MEASAAVLTTPLATAEAAALASLYVVENQLARLIRSLRLEDTELVITTRADACRIASARAEVTRQLLWLMAGGGLSMPELRLAASLLDIVGCATRMAQRCTTVAELTVRLDRRARQAGVCRTVERIGALTAMQLHDARQAFAARDAHLANRTVRRNVEVVTVGRQALEQTTPPRSNAPCTDSTIAVLVAARTLEQVADDAVEIAEQALLLVVEPFQEIAFVDRETQPESPWGSI